MPYGLRDKAWSPYAAGVLIGLLQIPAFLLINTALGASSSYVTVAAHLVSLVDPAVSGIKYAAQHLEGAKNWWQVAMVAGIAAGAFISSRLSGVRRRGFSPVWTRVVGLRSLAGRTLMGVAGGFVMLLGARIADGCTSGHGISGMAQLAVGSFVAVGAMFAGGILVAMMMKRL
ncbi:YeeE/YedE thiosulfate transporter family protein [Azospirillum rugosum]|uniref:Membrane protein YedE/YeeE n=1 Tax=Azospirillum rugosum TaxID=416170 RepID=A0ABS4SMK9_9PROT|nr:YeeE/YedE thiosulfate transporter family protein [Azospirillum rugosum]MBP2293318.1 putative membrane protein YedE/YeeE [Azospirillum rugosum]